MVVEARQKVLKWRLGNDDIIAALVRVFNGEPPGHPLVMDFATNVGERPGGGSSVRKTAATA
jgi:hypothetical protein